MPLQLVAVNHWEIAIDTHTANHPDVTHYCSDLEALDPRVVIPGGKLRLLVASPECTHFSNARGGEPVTNQNRASIKYVLRWLSAVEVEDVLIENVPEFRHWGPLHRQGPMKGRPIKARKGQYFRGFIDKLKKLGYRVEWRILCAADYGDATSRRRLFIRARSGNRPIVWPDPSHAAKSKTANMFGELLPYRTARDILSLDRKGESIFNRRKPLSENTMRRIMAGLRKFSGLPFILPNEGIFRGNAARSVDDPLPTVTGERGAGHVVEPFIVGAGGPEVGAQSVDDPLGTVLARNNRALVQPFIVGSGGPKGAAGPHSLDDPLSSVLGTNHQAVVQPFVVAIGQTGGNGDYIRSVDQPIPTIMGKAELALAEPYLVKYYEGSDAVSVDQPLPTITGNFNHLYVAQPYLINMYGTSDAGPVDAPVPTVTGGGQHIGVAQPFLLAIRGGDDGYMRGASVDEPVQTLTASSPIALIQPQVGSFIVQMEHSSEKSGDSRRVYDTGRPLPTITSKAHFGVVELEPFIVKYNGTGGAESVDDPIDTLTAVERFGLAMPVQNGWAIVDILFRMLGVDELARAHSMDDYTFTGTKKDVVKQIGNSVPRRLAKALCMAALA